MSKPVQSYDAASVLQRSIIPLIAVVVVGIVAGSAYTFYKKSYNQKIEKAGGELFTLQKELGKVASTLLPEEKDEALSLDKKIPPKTAAKPKATPEELAKGFSPIVEKLQTFIKANEGTQPAVEAALLVSEASGEYEKYSEGILALQTATKNFDKKNFLYGVAQNELGSLLAKTNKCNEATQAWEAVLALKEHDYLADQLRLKTGVCYQTLGMYDKAEKNFEAVVKKGGESSSSRMAKKFLLYIKYMKSKPSETTSEKS